MSRTLMLTGASGQLGSLVLDMLLSRGGERIVAGTRDPAKLAHLAERGVEVRRVDFDDESTLAEAFKEIDRLLIVSADNPAPGVRGEQHGRAIRAATAARVGYLVYTSFTNPAPDSAVQIAGDHAVSEAALRTSGIPFTSLRNNLYADFLVDQTRQAMQSGKLVTARGQGAAAYVTRRDCARAAVAALVGDDRTTRTLEITGPEAVTGDDLAALASELRGAPVEHLSLPDDAFADGLKQAGMPAPVVELLLSFERGIARGELTAVGDGFERLGIEPARPVRAWLREQLAR